MHRLQVVILEQPLRLLRGVIQRREHRGLVVVHVVARRPGEALLRRRRQRPIPLDAGVVLGLLGDERLGGAVAEGLVTAAVGVVVGRDRIEVQVREVVAEIPGPHPGHAKRGQRLHLMEAELEPLGVGERIDVLVDRAGAVPGDKQRDALVQVVDYLRVPLAEHVKHRAGGLVDLLVRVAVDVDEGVLRPVGRRLPRQSREIGLALEEAVEPLDLLVAAVGIRHRVDQHHETLADAADHRLLGDREPVRELEHRLGRAGLIRVQRRVEVVDRAGVGHDQPGSCRVRAARIGERRGRGLEALEVGDPRLVRDREHHDLATLLRAPDGEEPHPGRALRERAAIGIGGLRVDELARRPRNPVEVCTRRDHGGGGRQIRDPGRQKPRLGRRPRDLLDRAGLRGVGSGRLTRRERRGGERKQTEQCERLVVHEYLPAVARALNSWCGLVRASISY